jgi:hypothetical protein
MHRNFTLIARLEAEDFGESKFGFAELPRRATDGGLEAFRENRELSTHTAAFARGHRLLQAQALTRECQAHAQLPALVASEFDAVGWLVTTVCCLSWASSFSFCWGYTNSFPVSWPG